MKDILKNNRGAVIAILAGAFCFGLLSWDFKQQPGSIHIDKNSADTIPANRERKILDLDDVLRELEEAQFHLDKELKFDMQKMKKEMEESFRNFDMSKIKLEFERSMKDIDFDKMKADMEKSFKDLDFHKMKLEIEESMAKVDWDKMKLELEKVKEMDFSKLENEMKKLEVEMSKIGPEIERSMEKAKESMAKAKEEIKEYNTFIDQLEKDGLLKRSAGYTLKHKDGEFFIDGKKQSAEVYNKYRSFLEKHKSFNIEKTDGDFDIDLD